MSQDAPTVPAPSEFPQLPDLKLLRQIGKGAYGEVWLAVNEPAGRLRAVKLIRAEREEQAVLEYFGTNPQLHSNLVDLHYAGRTAHWVFYVMDPADDVGGGPASEDPAYVPATLSSRMAGRPLSLDQCIAYGVQLLQGLSQIHRAGFVHRDVKPANCWFFNGVLKLGDYGLVTRDNGANSMMGTPDYMPPDQRMDLRADVYACGLVLYQMLTGLKAREFPRLGEKALAHRRDPRMGPLNRLILKACAREFADGAEMLAALRAVELLGKRRSNLPRRALIATTLGCLILTGAGAAWVERWRHAIPRPAPPLTSVNFITRPFESDIYIDGRLAVDATTGKPMTTPCTIRGLSAARHHVIFRLPGREDLDAGWFDFSQQREVEVPWEMRH